MLPFSMVEILLLEVYQDILDKHLSEMAWGSYFFWKDSQMKPPLAGSSTLDFYDFSVINKIKCRVGALAQLQSSCVTLGTSVNLSRVSTLQLQNGDYY